MNHEDFNLLVAKCYVEDENFRKEYESLMEQKKGAMDVLKKNYIPNCKVYKLKEAEIEAEFMQKITDLCSAVESVAEKNA